MFFYEGLLVSFSFFFFCIFVFVKIFSLFLRDLTLRLQYRFLINEPNTVVFTDKTTFIFYTKTIRARPKNAIIAIIIA